jgi:hypothetical protein
MVSSMTDITGSKAFKPNTALKPFQALVGEWILTGSHPYLPETELHGHATIEWIQGGAFLMVRSELDHPKIPDGIEIFGSDDKAGTYHMLHFDERGVSRKYEVSITENELKWWRDDSEFSQRFTMEIHVDKLVSYGEMSRDGSDWEQDLSLTYQKL